MSESNSRVSVSEDKLRLLFAEFKLELVKELSSYARSTDLEKWRDSFDKRLRLVEDNITGSTAISRNQKWLLGIAATGSGAFIALLLFLITSGVH